MKQNNIKIAITGGIGSGKSTVCKIIEEKGYPVISFDKVYEGLFDSGKLTEKLVEKFGKKILNSEGQLDRKIISQMVFSDKKKLKQLNEITHPAIFERAFELTENNRLAFFEVPLLFEGGYQNLFDKIIVVLRDRQERIKSVILRDGLKEEDVISRIDAQYNYDNCDFAMYYVIHNSGKIADLSAKIDEILSNITA